MPATFSRLVPVVLKISKFMVAELSAPAMNGSRRNELLSAGLARKLPPMSIVAAEPLTMSVPLASSAPDPADRCSHQAQRDQAPRCWLGCRRR